MKTDKTLVELIFFCMTAYFLMVNTKIINQEDKLGLSVTGQFTVIRHYYLVERFQLKFFRRRSSQTLLHWKITELCSSENHRASVCAVRRCRRLYAAGSTRMHASRLARSQKCMWPSFRWFFIKGLQQGDKCGKKLWQCIFQRGEHTVLKLPAISCWLFAATVQIFLSAHGFISISAVGPITPHLFSLFLIFCLASRGAQAQFGRGKALPNHSLSSPRPRGPGNGRQECDDRTL